MHFGMRMMMIIIMIIVIIIIAIYYYYDLVVPTFMALSSYGHGMKNSFNWLAICCFDLNDSFPPVITSQRARGRKQLNHHRAPQCQSVGKKGTPKSQG